MASVDRELIADASNFTSGSGGKPKEFLFVHYTAGTGGAYDNCKYFAGSRNLQASAHYFVDDSEVCRSVRDADTAYAVGNFDMNQRSISIEVVSAGEDFSAAEIARLKKLVHELMAEHGIPADKVLRHYDAYDAAQLHGYGSGGWVDPYKRCPAPYIDAAKWAALWTEITGGGAAAEAEEDDMACIIRPDGADCLVYFDGHDFHDVPDPDCVEALDAVYRATHGGASMPSIELGTPEAPYFGRLVQVMRSGMPGADLVPTVGTFEPRYPAD